MESLFAAMESTAIAQYLRESRWGYAAVSTLHVLGITLLVGSILPFNLHILGLWRSIQRRILARVLVPVAASGLMLALTTGILLFAVRALEYSGIVLFQIKFVLVILGTLSAWLIHRRYGLSIEGATESRLSAHALVSILCWLGALTCGRLVAFVE